MPASTAPDYFIYRCGTLHSQSPVPHGIFFYVWLDTR